LIKDEFSNMFFEIISQEKKERFCAQSATFIGEEIFQSYLKSQTLITIFLPIEKLAFAGTISSH